MIIDVASLKNFFLVCGKTDLRKRIDGLVTFVMEEYNLDVYDQALFLFFGTKKDRFKALYWDANVFVLFIEIPNHPALTDKTLTAYLPWSEQVQLACK